MEFLVPFEGITAGINHITNSALPADKVLLARLAAIRTDLCVRALVTVKMLLLVAYARTVATLLLHRASPLRNCFAPEVGEGEVFCVST